MQQAPDATAAAINQCQQTVDTLITPFNVRAPYICIAVSRCSCAPALHAARYPQARCSPRQSMHMQTVNQTVQTFQTTIGPAVNTFDSVTDAVDPIVATIQGSTTLLVLEPVCRHRLFVM